MDTDETASRLLDVMTKERTGRVTFMPLNRLKPKEIQLPSETDCIPLLSKLDYEEHLRKAFLQVFGKTCVCRDLNIAAAYVKSHGINTITLDGDKVDRKGALTGGYHDIRRSRIQTIDEVTQWRTLWEAESKKREEIKAKIVALDQRITKLSGEQSVHSSEQTQIRDGRERIMHEGLILTREKDKLAERIEKLEKDIQELQTEIPELAAKITAYQAELRTPLSQGLTQAEEDLISTLTVDCETFKQSFIQLSKGKAELESQKDRIEIELNESLKRRKDEVQLKLDALGQVDGEETSVNDLASKEKELKLLDISIKSLTEKVQGTPMRCFAFTPLTAYPSRRIRARC